jgi:hypothetical protein
VERDDDRRKSSRPEQRILTREVDEFVCARRHSDGRA